MGYIHSIFCFDFRQFEKDGFNNSENFLGNLTRISYKWTVFYLNWLLYLKPNICTHGRLNSITSISPTSSGFTSSSSGSITDQVIENTFQYHTIREAIYICTILISVTKSSKVVYSKTHQNNTCLIKVYRLHNFHPKTGHEGLERYRCSSTLCLTTTLDESGDGQHQAPASLSSGKRICTHCIGGWVGLRASLDGSGKFRSPTGIRSLGCPGLRESLVGLRYPSPLKSIWNTAVWFEAAHIYLKLFWSIKDLFLYWEISKKTTPHARKNGGALM